jgi:hypothetical protein
MEEVMKIEICPCCGKPKKPKDFLLGDSRRFAELVAGCGAVVTSPPFLDQGRTDGRTFGGLKTPPPQNGAQKTRTVGFASHYGTSPGQVGVLPAGDVGAVVTSPPWERSLNDGGNHEEMRTRYPGWGLNPDGSNRMAASVGQTYGTTPGQVGRESGETYWSACRLIYLECLKALRPNGVMCVVLKGYVRNGALVDLPGQALRLLCALGFEPVERIRAWLTEERREAGLFGEVVTTKSRASFFRRLAEKRGAPPIRWEEVLVVRKGTDRFDAPAAKGD